MRDDPRRGACGGLPVRLLYDRRARALAYQALLLLVVLVAGYEIVTNTMRNLEKQNIASGLGFLGRTAGFDISQSLIAYANTMSYGRAFLVGLLNTLLVAGLGIVLATLLGFVVGIARLSPNWLIARLGTVYVEIIRNVPLLLQLFMWYFAVLKNLPGPRQSIALPLGAQLNVRGLYLPHATWEKGAGFVAAALLAGLTASVVLAVWARRRRRQSGQPFPVLGFALALSVGMPILVFLAAGRPVTLDYPVLKGFNLVGGFVIQPEFTALLVGLVVYTASFIAEIVRSGILAVSKGQKEAAAALGLTRTQMLRLVVVPQAMRVIIPPLTSQFLNLTKNSSLAVAIGYPDLVSVFAGTVLNQTGQAVEVILITMGVYLTLSLATALLMSWFDARFAIRER